MLKAHTSLPLRRETSHPVFNVLDVLPPAVQQLVYTSSVDIRPEWAVKEQIPFTALAKLTCTPPELSDLSFHGSLRFYDKVPPAQR